MQEPSTSKDKYFSRGIFIWCQTIQTISTYKHPLKWTFHIKIENTKDNVTIGKSKVHKNNDQNQEITLW